jgi:lysophospholipase L1-like esterase
VAGGAAFDYSGRVRRLPMSHVRCCLIVTAALFLLTASAIAQRPATVKDAPAKAKTPADPNRFEKDIAAFEAPDKESPPPKDGVVFVGSSSIRLWDLKQSFPEVVALNRGFGGSQMSDAVKYAGRIVTPYKPRLIVLYEGDNDLNAGKSPEQVAADFNAFLKIVRADLPTTPLVVIGMKPSPSRWRLIEQQREANRLVAERCAKDGKCRFLDVEKAMLGSDGQPKPEIFRADKLHLNDEGYKIWNELIRPLLAAN